jgi:hypothetical protein
MLSRRRFIQATGSALLLPEEGIARRRGGAGGIPIWRALGQNMRYQVNAFTTSGPWSATYRSRHYSNVSLTGRFRCVMPTFWSTGTPIADVDFPGSFNYQIGFEYPFNNFFTGIPTRPAFTLSGSSVLSFVSGVGPFGQIVSDILSVGPIPANTFFGLHTTVENAAGTAATGSILPYQVLVSDNYQAGYERYSGFINASSSLITSGQALTASSIPQASNVQSGINLGMQPLFLLAEQDSSTKLIMLLGDSICYGVDEGQAGSNASGDSLGSPLGNAGIFTRWVYETLNYNAVNFGHGSDQFAFFSAINWKYRLPLIALANPTHVLSQNGHNDVVAGIIAPMIVGSAANFISVIRQTVNGVTVIQSCCTPNSSSSALWTAVDGSDQTVVAPFGNSNSTRGQWNLAVRTQGSIAGVSGSVDPNPPIEYNYVEGNTATETSKWKGTGQPNGYTVDGTHLNSFGYSQVPAGIVCRVNGVTVSNPFQ